METIFQSQEADESTLSSILEVVKILLRTEYVEVNAQDLRGGLTPLYYAAEAGNRYAIASILMKAFHWSTMQIFTKSCVWYIRISIKCRTQT